MTPLSVHEIAEWAQEADNAATSPWYFAERIIILCGDLSEARAWCVAAESRIAAALACHTQAQGMLLMASGEGQSHGFLYCAECRHEWDTEADRCTSPTVRALTGDAS